MLPKIVLYIISIKCQDWQIEAKFFFIYKWGSADFKKTDAVAIKHY